MSEETQKRTVESITAEHAGESINDAALSDDTRACGLLWDGKYPIVTIDGTLTGEVYDCDAPGETEEYLIVGYLGVIAMSDLLDACAAGLRDAAGCGLLIFGPDGHPARRQTVPL